MRTAFLPDGVVTLDVASDRYLCTYDPRLAEQGATVTAPGMGWRDLPAVADSRPSLAVMGRFVCAMLRTLAQFALLDFAQLIAVARRAPPAQSLGASSDVGKVVADFERLCAFVPFRFQCLFRSVLLLHFLRGHGIHADWTFGVSLFPFTAHCWVARGDLLLGERTERIAGLVQILRVEAPLP